MHEPYIWNLHETYMNCTWNLYEAYTLYQIWIIYETYMSHISEIYKYLVCKLACSYMKHAWDIHEIYKAKNHHSNSYIACCNNNGWCVTFASLKWWMRAWMCLCILPITEQLVYINNHEICLFIYHTCTL